MLAVTHGEAAAARVASDALDWAQVVSQAEAEAVEARDEAPLRAAQRQARQLKGDNQRLQAEKAEADERASRLCAADPSPCTMRCHATCHGDV